MSDEQQIEEGLLAQDEPVVEGQVETPDPAEQAVSFKIPDEDTPEEIEAAKAKGWVPEGVSGKPRKTARQYLRDGELIEAVMPLHKKIKEQEDALRKLSERAEKRDAEARQKAIQELTYKRDMAVMNGDLDSFHKVNKELSEFTAKPAPEQNSVDTGLTSEQQEAINDFTSRNAKWFNDSVENVAMKAEAISKSNEIAAQIANKQLPNLSPKQQLEIVEDHIKRLFSDRFENPNRTTPAAVSSGAVKADVKVKTSINSLNDSDKKSYIYIRDALAKKGKTYTVDDFLKDF